MRVDLLRECASLVVCSRLHGTACRPGMSPRCGDGHRAVTPIGQLPAPEGSSTLEPSVEREKLPLEELAPCDPGLGSVAEGSSTGPCSVTVSDVSSGESPSGCWMAAAERGLWFSLVQRRFRVMKLTQRRLNRFCYAYTCFGIGVGSFIGNLCSSVVAAYVGAGGITLWCFLVVTAADFRDSSLGPADESED